MSVCVYSVFVLLCMVDSGLEMGWSFLFFYLVCEATGTAATPGLLCQHRVIVKMIVEKQMECRLCRGNKPKFSEKTCPSASFVHHKIPHDQTRIWTRAAAVGSRRLTAWAMGRPSVFVSTNIYTNAIWIQERYQYSCTPEDDPRKGPKLVPLPSTANKNVGKVSSILLCRLSHFINIFCNGPDIVSRWLLTFYLRMATEPVSETFCWDH
jgi:hypothetical protein